MAMQLNYWMEKWDDKNRNDVRLLEYIENMQICGSIEAKIIWFS